MQKLKGELQEFRRFSKAEGSEVAIALRMHDYLVSIGSQAFDRNTRPAHFTGSALVVSPDGTQVLLLWHKKLQKWLQPGGHADGDADLEHVAVREVHEETGLEVDLMHPGIYGVDWHPIPANPKESAHEHADCVYLVKARTWNTAMQLDEVEQLKWFAPKDAIAQAPDASVQKLIRRYFGDQA